MSVTKEHAVTNLEQLIDMWINTKKKDTRATGAYIYLTEEFFETFVVAEDSLIREIASEEK